MLKKTTVYLSDEDISLLKKKATVQNKTVAEVIRLSIQKACKPESKEEAEVWKSLDKIWARTGTLDSHKVEAAVDKAVKEVRGAKKARRGA
jgi:hypothetical protein